MAEVLSFNQAYIFRNQQAPEVRIKVVMATGGSTVEIVGRYDLHVSTQQDHVVNFCSLA